MDGQIYVISGRRYKLTYRTSKVLADIHAAVAADQASLNKTLEKFPVNRHPYSFTTEPLAQRLPSTFSHRPLMTKVKDQGTRGTCYAFSTLAQHEYNWLFQGFSEQFLIWSVKSRDDVSEGANTLEAITALTEDGVCRDSLAPYTDYTPFPIWGGPEPSQDARTNAKLYPSRSRLWLNRTTDDLESAIAEKGYVVTVEVPVFDKCWPSSGIVHMPTAANIAASNAICSRLGDTSDPATVMGGAWHAICLTGYNNGESCFEFKNSWGSDWGNGGYGTIPYEYITKYADSALVFG